MILFVPVRCATPKFGDFLKDELWIERGKRSHRITLVTRFLAFGDASESTAQHPAGWRITQNNVHAVSSSDPEPLYHSLPFHCPNRFLMAFSTLPWKRGRLPPFA